MGVNYHVSYPDFRVSHEESEMCFYPLEEIQHIQSGHMHNQVLEDFLLMLIIVYVPDHGYYYIRDILDAYKSDF